MSILDGVLLEEFKERELEILALMATGCSNKEIGEQLFITKETVRWYNKQIYSKLGTSRRTEAIAKARRLGLLVQEATTATPAHPHNLPTITTPFLGRHHEIDELKSLLKSDHTRLITILGPGGMGKTRTAIELGHRVRSHFIDGVYLFELTALTQAESIVQSMAQTLQLTDSATTKQMLLDHCRQKCQLLIFDNFEHLLDGAALLDELLRNAPDVRVIVTSRERLNLYGETVYELAGLHKTGGELFLASAQAMQAGFQLSEKEAEAEEVERIIEMVGGLPLAIILAAAWVESLTVREIADELSRDLDLLITDMSNVPERQRNIRTVLTASWQKLTAQEQSISARLAIFQGGFSRAAARNVADASLPILQKLQHKSFVQRAAARRYDLHPLVRQFALEQLETSGNLHETHARHVAYYRAYITETLEALSYGDYIEPLNQVAVDHENVRVALDWGLTQADVQGAASLAAAMHSFWSNRSYASEAIHYLGLALTKVHQQEKRAELLLKRSQACLSVQQLEWAERDAREALHIAKTAKHETLQLESLGYLGAIMQEKGDYATMAEVAGQYVRQSEASGSSYHQARSLNLQSSANSVLGNLDIAQDAIRKALQLARQAEDDSMIARFTYNLGLLLQDHNYQIAEARTLFEESLQLKRLIGDRAGIISRLTVLSNLSTLNGQYQQTTDYLNEARTLCEEVKSPRRKMQLLSSQGYLYEAQQEWADALRIYKECLEIARENNYSYYLIRAHMELAKLYLSQNLADPSRRHLQACLQRVFATNSGWVHGILSLVLSEYFWHQADYPMSAQLYFAHLQAGRLDPIYVNYANRLRQNHVHQFTPSVWESMKADRQEEDIHLLFRKVANQLE